ncbi:MAG TPA: CpaD family pilus assembly lipoprotein [Alphaproteobacteria bacterium]
MQPVRLYPPVGAILLMALVLAFSACAPQTSRWSPAEAPKENKVTFIRVGHVVRFAPGDDRLAATEADRLAAFLARHQVGFGERVTLLGPDLATTRRRMDAVAAALAPAGIKVVRGGPIEGADVAPGALHVVVERHLVTPPVCPDWSKPAGEDFTNYAGSNFGCATAVNLGLMVADPADLLGGRSLGPADGDVAAQSIERYRLGKTKPLIRMDSITTEGN